MWGQEHRLLCPMNYAPSVVPRDFRVIVAVTVGGDDSKAW